MAVSDDDICYLPILEIGRRLVDGSLTSLALTNAFIDRISAHGSHLKAFARMMTNSALSEAEKADAERRAGLVRGPLHGIPVAIKDLIDTKGIITAAGMTIRADNVPDKDATVVQRLRDAGAVILGKLTLTEGATLSHHPTIAAPRNPWNTSCNSGFSSSGSGVAVAAGLCVAALGSDTGGSIRIPSSYNGVTGLKPTWGRVSRHGVFGLTEYYDTVGPMARSAAAAAAMLGAMAGSDPHDPSAEDVVVPDYLGTIGEGVSAVTIGVDWAAIEADCSKDVAEGLRHTARVLADRGARILPVTLPAADLPSIMALAAVGMADVHRATYPARAVEYGPAIRSLLDLGLATGGMDTAAAISAVRAYRARLRGLFADVDLVLAPAMTTPAPPIGAIEAESAADPTALFRRMAYTLPFNASGNPTITFPTGLSDGLPIAAQIIAPHFCEALLFRAAQSFQSVTDWHLRRPPVGASNP